MTVYETHLPGVGRKFDLELDAGGDLLVAIDTHEEQAVLKERVQD